MAKARDLIILINRNSLTIAGGNLNEATKVELDKTIFSDLEIVDKKLLSEKILAVISKSETQVNLILIFSDEATFSKELPINSSTEVLQNEEKMFLHNLPFDKVSNKLIKFTNNYLLVGINWDICEAIAESLKEIGYKLLIVIPALVIGGFDQKNGLTNVSYSSIVSKKDQLKQFSLIQVSNENIEPKPQQLIISKRSNMPLLVGIFIFLLTVLAFLIIRSN